MAKTHPSIDHFIEDDFIDIDLNLNPSNFLRINASSNSRNSREFEFKLCTNATNPQERDNSHSTPADELFYKGNLLPLHHHPRIQTIQRLKSRHFNYGHEQEVDQLEEKNREKRNSWCKKFKGINNSSLSSKLKASRAYFKSLFTKSRFSDDSCEVSKSKNHGNVNNYVKGRRKSPNEEEDSVHRKSFSDVIKWRLVSKSNSSLNSNSNLNSNGICIFETQKTILRRSSSVNSEVENPIQGAISYCKKSQQFISGRKSVTGAGIYSF
ncbi:hypothetical protein LUZ60_012998 [Juncus effusus]|nr:hypothetical protein LUZ60_012998 [Juncus effusus]